MQVSAIQVGERRNMNYPWGKLPVWLLGRIRKLVAYTKTRKLEAYAMIRKLEAYATARKLEAYATTRKLEAYATTRKLEAYATTRKLEAYATTRKLEAYATLLLVCLGGGFAFGIDEDVSRPIRSEKNVVFREVEGQKVRADVFRPADEQLCPLVVMIHGGAWSAGDKWDLVDHAREMAQAGFVAVSINYRLAPRCQIDGQIEDCRAGIQWAVEQAPKWKADPNRVALWGYSAGAHLASLIALDRTAEAPKISAVVAGGAPCEFSFIAEDSQVLRNVFGSSRRDDPEAYAKVSPINFASKAAPPFFFFHGTADWLVPNTSSKALFERLKSKSVPVEYCEVDGKGHLLSFIDAAARQQAIAFLQNHLEDSK